MCKLCSIKCIFIFFNAIFLASGIVLITIGAMQYSTYFQIGIFAGGALSKIAIVLIAVGVTITLVSLLGHVGAFFNNSSMLSCFICILIVIILMEVITGAAFYIFRSRTLLLHAKSGIETNAQKAIHEYRMENRHAIDRIQEKFHCCGADSSDDWANSDGWTNHEAVPDSCCMTKTDGCGQDKQKIYTKACTTAIKFFLLKNLVWVGAICITLGITEVFGVVVGVCLCLNIKKKSYENLN